MFQCAPPLHQTRPKLFTSLSGRFRFIKPVQVPEANRQNVIRVGIVRFEPNGLSQIFQCDFVFACIDVGASERPMPTVPLFDSHQPASLLPAFKESLQRMGGRPGTPPA